MSTRTSTPHASYAPYTASLARAAQPIGESGQSPHGVGLRLAAYTLLILFFELALIRYTAAHVRVFGFYSNFVLIAAFLGMGVGLLRADAVRGVKWLAIPAALLLVGSIVYLSRTPIAVPDGPAEHFWAVFEGSSAPRGVPLVWVVVGLFGLCTLFFVPLGALVGAEFRMLPPLRAYSLDIAGSLLGIVVFAALSAARHPPIVWFAVGFTVWVLASLADRRYAIAMGATAVAVVVMASPRASGPEYWSPYYRLTVEHGAAGSNVYVNGSLHQVILNFADTTASFPRIARAGYLQPYAFTKRIDTALVVGAGTGNDLALLLRLGAKHIDAVEIDPVILDLGRATHRQRPYADPRVHPYVDDARAFLRKTAQQYDVIVFGTLDSQTLLSGMSSVRLDNYVYTVESFRAARRRLKPEGTLILYHMAGFPHIAAKIYAMLSEAFEAPPRMLREHYLLFNHTFIAGHGARGAAVTLPPRELTGRVPHDDWPYLYLQKPSIPVHYAIALGAVLLIAIVSVVATGASRGVRQEFDGAMFLMGVGFLLVETKSVTEMSLLFGSTWKVNLLVFSSILVMVLAANVVVVRRWAPKMQWLFAGLLASLVAAFAVPASRLLWFGPAGQWAVGSFMVGLPVLFAALIFATLLRRRLDASRALAYNLLGAVVGGLLEYASMAGGIKLLYILAAAAYVGAALFVRRENQAATEFV